MLEVRSAGVTIMPFTTPIRVEAFQWHPAVLGLTATTPSIVSVSDADGNEFDVVLKVPYPTTGVGANHGHFGRTSLAAELICAAIGRAAGLNVPDYFIVEVKSEWIASLPTADIRDRLRRNAGLGFGLQYLPSTPLFSWYASAKTDGLRDQLEDVLSFDATVINGDRCEGNSNLLYDGEDVFLIDHSLAMLGHDEADSATAASELMPQRVVHRHCSWCALVKSRRKCDRIFARWSASLPTNWLEELRTLVPAQWEETPGDQDRIFGFLEHRVRYFQAIANDLEGHLR